MPRSIRFRYNPVFLPEYLSTILISIPISALFMATPIGGGRAAFVANPHLGVAIGLYLSIAGWLMMLTIMYRRQFCPVIFYCQGHNGVWIDGGRGEISLPNVAEVRQSLGKFFGRIVRRIHIEDNRGNSAVFCDAIFHFDQVRNLLAELLDGPEAGFLHDEPSLVDRVKSLWDERHTMFPATETLGDVFSRLSWRGVCLLPVGVVDVLINLTTILSLSKFQKHTLMVYSAPLALLVSAFIARFIYYYMFTSTTMNKPLGVKTR
jgi:hypothetical protein